MSETATLLREKEASLDRRVSRLRGSLEKAEAELAEVRTALKVLIGLGLVEEEQGQSEPDGGNEALNENQSAVLSCVPFGEENAVAPKTIIDTLEFTGQALNGDYVRTVLWRAATKRNLIRSKNGLYWRDKEEAPAEAEASRNSGPVGRERGYPPSTPEGSTPSGSTRPPLGFETELEDDDVPF